MPLKSLLKQYAESKGAELHEFKVSNWETKTGYKFPNDKIVVYEYPYIKIYKPDTSNSFAEFVCYSELHFYFALNLFLGFIKLDVISNNDNNTP